MAIETALATSGGFVGGAKLYHERARQILPLLVRQAKAGQPIYYSDLAREIGIPSERTLNYPLGAIGGELQNLSKKWNQKIPMLQSLVINKTTRMPGEGFDLFLDERESFRGSSPGQRRKVVDMMLAQVYAFRDWDRVLAELRLPSAKAALQKLPSPLTSEAKGPFSEHGSGEGEEHRRLKEYVASHPEAIGLRGGFGSGVMEYNFASADVIDVLFKARTQWVGVEVKSIKSNEVDIVRGMFQCVKYAALIEAEQKALQLPVHARVLLVLASDIPSSLIPLQNVLGIEVVADVALPVQHAAAAI